MFRKAVECEAARKCSSQVTLSLVRSTQLFSLKNYIKLQFNNLEEACDTLFNLLFNDTMSFTVAIYVSLIMINNKYAITLIKVHDISKYAVFYNNSSLADIFKGMRVL